MSVYEKKTQVFDCKLKMSQQGDVGAGRTTVNLNVGEQKPVGGQLAPTSLFGLDKGDQFAEGCGIPHPGRRLSGAGVQSLGKKDVSPGEVSSSRIRKSPLGRRQDGLIVWDSRRQPRRHGQAGHGDVSVRRERTFQWAVLPNDGLGPLGRRGKFEYVGKDSHPGKEARPCSPQILGFSSRETLPRLS